jgi:hypothetical protein
MIKNGFGFTSPFANLVELANRRRKSMSAGTGSASAAYGNGLDDAPMLRARARVARAESELEDAREAMRDAARSAGVSLDGLFGDCEFIRRSTGDRWYAAGKREGAEKVVDAMLRARDLDPKKERARIAAESEAAGIAHRAEAAKWRATMTEAGFFDALNRNDFEEAVKIYNGVMGPRDKAAQILAAGRKARMGGSNPLPEPVGTAAKIIEMGRRRRGEI